MEIGAGMWQRQNVGGASVDTVPRRGRAGGRFRTGPVQVGVWHIERGRVSRIVGRIFLRSVSGANLLHIPCRGGGPAMTGDGFAR